MIKLAKEIYIREELKKDIEEIKSKLVGGIVPKSLYFICMSENEAEVFDIFSSFEFNRKIVLEKDRVIFGISYTKNDAFSIVEDMINEYFNINNKLDVDVSLRQYFLNK